jgi:hypothetical protein
MHTSGDDFALIVFWSANRLIAFKCPTWCASVMRPLYWISTGNLQVI